MGDRSDRHGLTSGEWQVLPSQHGEHAPTSRSGLPASALGADIRGHGRDARDADLPADRHVGFSNARSRVPARLRDGALWACHYVSVQTVEDVLRNLKLGSRVAEDEADTLASYFVETDQFRRLLRGEIDVVFGPKGAGKSAIYSALLGRADEMFDAGVTLVAGEIPRGTPAFRDVVIDPPTSEAEFTAIWKFYILSLVNGLLEDFDVKGDPAATVRQALAAEGLAQGPGGL